MPRTPILIAGPTASGKSHLALGLARRMGGAIINADSMQVYDGLRVLTARPSPEDEAQAPHHLFGVLNPSIRCSVGRWSNLAAEALVKIKEQGLTPIFVGGTGLYFRALTLGLSAIPEIPAEIRKKAIARLAEVGTAGLYADVAARDPKTAGRLGARDSQRVQRAWEVLEATGKGLAAWQGGRKEPVLKGSVRQIVLMPPRDWLYARCEARLDQMVKEGALSEVAELLDRGLDPTLPAMKALGVRELAAHLKGDTELPEALEQAKKLTRRYAKRQLTWMRNQMADWPRLDPVGDELIHRALKLVSGPKETI